MDSTAGDSGPCRAARGQGACWALIGEKHRFLLFATYPYEEHWRPALACAILIALYGTSSLRRFWTRWLICAWAVGLALIAMLMWGGILGLSFVSQDLWGGLPVTLLLATFGIAFALPLGILLALGRRTTEFPVIRVMCVGYIELIRGVPLISLLFMASFLFPLFMPAESPSTSCCAHRSLSRYSLPLTWRRSCVAGCRVCHPVNSRQLELWGLDTGRRTGWSFCPKRCATSSRRWSIPRSRCSRTPRSC